jgi:sporulation protein YlmC with PRC-barrel domain
MRNSIVFTLAFMLAAAMAFVSPAFAWSPQLGAQSSPAPQSNVISAANSSSSLFATNIIGKQVKDDRGEALGNISNLVVSPEGDITYALVTPNARSNTEARKVAIPWSALELPNANGGAYALNISKEQFDNAPTVNGAELARMSGPRSGENVYGYYGRPAPEHGILRENESEHDIVDSLMPGPSLNRNGEPRVKRGGA